MDRERTGPDWRRLRLAAARSGVDVRAFWHHTPDEIALAVEAENQRARERVDLSSFTAYRVRELIWAKKLPPLSKVLGGKRGGPSRADIERLRAHVVDVYGPPGDKRRQRTWTQPSSA